MNDELTEILAPYQGQKGALIPVLQRVQNRLGYLSEEEIREIAKFLRISPSEVFGVASFYAQFRFARQGDHCVKVCRGTACHVRGAPQLLRVVEEQLGIEPGGTTEDYKFSLETIACFGSCALAPVMVADDHVHGRMTGAKVKEILNKIK